MIVSPSPVNPSSVATSISAAVRQYSRSTQNGSPFQGAVTRIVRTPVTCNAAPPAEIVADRSARNGAAAPASGGDLEVDGAALWVRKAKTGASPSTLQTGLAPRRRSAPTTRRRTPCPSPTGG